MTNTLNTTFIIVHDLDMNEAFPNDRIIGEGIAGINSFIIYVNIPL